MHSAIPASTPHLNSLGLEIRQIDGKGRGVIASKPLPRHTLVEISPVLLFAPDEYKLYGKQTVLDEYTFCWPGRDGCMALALGIGSLFNHSSSPNLSYMIDKESQCIRFTTSQPIQEGEELCIFYSHKLWFEDRAAANNNHPGRRRDLTEVAEDNSEDLFARLSRIEGDGSQDELVEEDRLPFEEVKYEAEDEEDTIRTMDAWVVDVPDPRKITSLLDYIRDSELDTPDLQHLKRIRRPPSSSSEQPSATLLISIDKPDLLSPPCPLPPPYQTRVPTHAARTLEEAALKSEIWPTTYQPRRRDREVRQWTQREVKWIERGIRRVWEDGKRASRIEEVAIAAFVPDEEGVGTRGISAHDTRTSERHPLRHSVMNLLRRVSDATPVEVGVSEIKRNGQQYLLTSRTLFTTHEPCVMCTMALLHSRVKEIFFIFPMTQTGGCGGLTCVPSLKGVNHRFAIWKWKHREQLGEAIEVGEWLDA